MTPAWAPGAVTGIGSLPGTEPDDAAALVFGELPDFPHLPELPARGIGAAMIGRSAALLVDLPVELAASGWQIAAHAGRDLRAARDHLARDLDALEARAVGYAGPLKLQAAGPWTLAADIELSTGHKIITDRGAVRDLVGSLAEGLRAHLADVAARVPGAELVLQVDEPSLPAVLGGRIATPSGYGTVRAIEAEPAAEALRTVLAVGPDGGRVVHCCAPDVPIALLYSAGADAVSLDVAHLERTDYDAVGEAVEAGAGLWLGVIATDGTRAALDTARAPIAQLWSELGFAPEQLAAHVVATPACGLAGRSPDAVRRILAVLRDVGKWLADPDSVTMQR